MRHVVTAEAYERKASLGGGFRAVVRDHRAKGEDGRHTSDILASKDEAINWARSKVFAIMGETAWRPGYVYRPNWRMNVFSAAKGEAA